MKDSKWVISPITADDLPAIFAIEQQSSSPWSMDQLEEELAGGHALALTCRHPDNNQLTSFIMGRTVSGEAEILKIATNPPDRRQGAACTLINVAIKLFKRKNIRKCHLELRSSNTPARCLYEKFDFLMTGLRNNYYSKPQDDALCMTLSIF